MVLRMSRINGAKQKIWEFGTQQAGYSAFPRIWKTAGITTSPLSRVLLGLHYFISLIVLCIYLLIYAYQHMSENIIKAHSTKEQTGAHVRTCKCIHESMWTDLWD